MAVAPFPALLLYNEPRPKAELLFPEVLFVRELYPVAVLFKPVLLIPEFAPKKTLYPEEGSEMPSFRSSMLITSNPMVFQALPV